MTNFDYAASAELYAGKGKGRAGHVRYRRFESAAAALRYSIEEMPSDLLLGSVLEVAEQRFSGSQLRAHYDAAGYPLPRSAQAKLGPE